MMVFLCTIPFRSIYLGKIGLVTIWFRMILTQIITQVYKYSHLRDSHQILIFDWYYNLIPTGRFFGTIIHVNYRFHVATRPTTVQTPILPWKVFYARQLILTKSQVELDYGPSTLKEKILVLICNKFAMVGICGPHAEKGYLCASITYSGKCMTTNVSAINL